MKMDFSEQFGVQAHTLKEQLVPNFHLLDHHVQNQIVNILETILTSPQKRVLQQFSKQGFLEEAPLLRSHIWKLLLETLPNQPSSWHAHKTNNLELYNTFIQKFIGKYVHHENLTGMRQGFDPTLWTEIELDTRRTHSALNFYQKNIEHTKIYANKPTKNSDVLTRILYIWGKINPAVRYVQGMNEILAPIYYLEYQMHSQFSEPDVFFMFSSLMAFLMDMHIKDMDESEQGIMGRMRILNKYLKVVDYQLWNRLEKEKILPQYYSFRWLALLLAQQFGLYETMKLWDVMLSFDGYKRYFYLYCCCIAILKYRKQFIMKNDFISILPVIQKLRDVNVFKIIEIANKLYEKYSKINIEKLYLRMNEEIERKNAALKQKHRQQEKWSYSNVFEKTGIFFSNLVNKK